VEADIPLAEFLIGVIAVGRKYGAVTFYRKMLLPGDNLALKGRIEHVTR
jgi:hypothetical protein